MLTAPAGEVLTGMLLGKLKLNPQGRPMWLWLKLQLTPKGPFLNCQIVLRSAKLPLFNVCEQASYQLTRENLRSLA